MFFGSKRKGIDINTCIGRSGVVLEGLDKVEVCAFTFRESVLTVKLEFGCNDRVFTPAVHVEGRFSEDKGASIGDRRTFRNVKVRRVVTPGVTGRWVNIISTGILELTRRINERVVGASSRKRTTKGVDRVGEGINRISIVEGLRTKEVEEL